MIPRIADGKVEIDRTHFRTFLAEKAVVCNPGNSDNGHCFFAQYLSANNVPYLRMWAYDTVVVSDTPNVEALLPEWARTISRVWSSESSDSVGMVPMTPQRALALFDMVLASYP